MRALSLFAGVGCWDLGLQRAGHEIVRQVEIDPDCQRVLRKHFPGVRLDDDVRTAQYEENEADVVVFGSPCQDLSQMGSRTGLAGARSGLLWEAVRAVRVVRPAVAAMENVVAILRRGMGAVLGQMAESGYDAEWDCIPKAHVGAPDLRDRLWALFLPQHSDALRPRPHPAPVHLDGGAQLFDWQERLAGPMGAPLAAALARLGPASGRKWDSEPQLPRVADRTTAGVAVVKQAGNHLSPLIAQAIGEALSQHNPDTGQ